MTTIRSMMAGVVALVASLVFLADALAQTPPASPPTRLRGTISAIDGKTATIATREGTSVPVKLADNWSVMLVSPMTMADIKENSFVGIASLKGPDGTLNALEVLVFPEAARGSGEGHYPWDLEPESMMTNATVSDVVAVDAARRMTLKYKDGQQVVLVPPNVPIVTFEPGDRAMLVPGAHIMFGATRQPDGTLTATRINVGKDG